jgi:hypothetical protein
VQLHVHVTMLPPLADPARRVDELSAELEGVKRLSAQKQLQDKVQCRASACALQHRRARAAA